MVNMRSPRWRVTARQLGIGAILAVLAIVTQAGCGREFFRDWANQDVSEAVFEKSRDPRWRLQTCPRSSHRPCRGSLIPTTRRSHPLLPTHLAAEALSPVPQWPDNRLLIPVEGTGYMELLDKRRREADEAPQHARIIGRRIPASRTALEPARPPQTSFTVRAAGVSGWQ